MLIIAFLKTWKALSRRGSFHLEHLLRPVWSNKKYLEWLKAINLQLNILESQFLHAWHTTVDNDTQECALSKLWRVWMFCGGKYSKEREREREREREGKVLDYPDAWHAGWSAVIPFGYGTCLARDVWLCHWCIALLKLKRNSRSSKEKFQAIGADERSLFTMTRFWNLAFFEAQSYFGTRTQCGIDRRETTGSVTR